VHAIKALRSGLAEIERAREGLETLDDEQAAALRRLRSYRFLCGIPHEVSWDPAYAALAEAAAKICEKLGQLTHDPENPDLPEDEFSAAHRGASRSNLSFGASTLREALDLWMDDSDAGNVDRLGHRRWCLNPAMGKTGMGRSGTYAAMHVLDFSRAPEPVFEFVAFPPAGYLPRDYYPAGTAWSLSLNPSRYRAPRSERVAVRVNPVEAARPHLEHPLTLVDVRVETSGFGIPNCIIFRPRDLDSSAGLRYRVSVKGLERSDGSDAEIEYVVEFLP
jgi:hypothetical protein